MSAYRTNDQMRFSSQERVCRRQRRKGRTRRLELGAGCRRNRPPRNNPPIRGNWLPVKTSPVLRDCWWAREMLHVLHFSTAYKKVRAKKYLLKRNGNFQRNPHPPRCMTSVQKEISTDYSGQVNSEQYRAKVTSSPNFFPSIAMTWFRWAYLMGARKPRQYLPAGQTRASRPREEITKPR
jgi:hypothetical protein